MAHQAFQEILSEIERSSATSDDVLTLQEFTVRLIAARLPHYNWVGFYMLDRNDADVLVLGPFHGAPTDHVRILVTEGICGAAVAQGKTVIVDDVSADPRYLSCSIETKSEIVVPIRVRDKVVGEIDIDSHDLSAFGPDDRTFLEKCARLIGGFMEEKHS
jgi:L-methionine (R)-S-oxide reductase